MDLALIGAGVGATIQVVLQNMIQGRMEQIIQFWGVDEDMEELNSSLLMIQDFVSDAEMKQVNERAVRRWLEQLEDVAFDADAVLDEFNYEILRQKVEKPNQAWNEVTTFFTSGLFRKEMADRIKTLNKRLNANNKRARDYGLQMAVVGADHSSTVGLVAPLKQTNSFSHEPNVVGREVDESKIVEMLLSTPQDKKLSVIPILGMAGLGKTTLARKVFKNVKIRVQFEKRIWVCAENVLDGLQPHPSLKSLEIVWYKSKNFPSWIMKMAVHNEIEGRGEVLCNLMEIKLKNCKECEEVPMFGHLPQLRFLSLKGLSNVRSIGQSFYGLENGGMTENVNCRELLTMFPALEKLKLEEMTELSEWVEVEGATSVFPCLKYLRIENCYELKSFPSHFPCLEELFIFYCPELESIPCVEGLTSLRELHIGGCDKLKEISLNLNTPFSLEELDIANCGELKSIKKNNDSIWKKSRRWRRRFTKATRRRRKGHLQQQQQLTSKIEHQRLPRID